LEFISYFDIRISYLLDYKVLSFSECIDS
jgi:hypothetical protein